MKIIPATRATFALTALLLAASWSVKANLIQNGSFENGTFSLETATAGAHNHWQSAGFAFTANSGTAVILFLAPTPGYDHDRVIDFDNVALVLVPEPTTVIAGALLLLPFGVSTLRILRKNRAA